MDGSFDRLMRLKGKVVVVTGAGRGIGFAIARLFAQLGARVVIAERSSDLGQAAAAALVAEGYDVVFCQTDVSDGLSVTRLMLFVDETFAGCDIVINNAGITADTAVRYMEDDQWDDVIRVNLRGTFLMCRAFGRYMADCKTRGAMVNISSIVRRGHRGQGNYAASKAAVVAFSRSLAIELGKFGIRVNCVAPGYTHTDMTADVKPAVIDGIVAAAPLGRLADPEEIAAAVVFLCSEAASYITGSVLDVDGGQTV